MIVDTSALIAILAGESDSERYINALAEADGVRISAGTLLEASLIVDANKDPVLAGKLDDLVRVNSMVVEPFTWTQAEHARNAYRLFGKGSGHAAQLNFGDCFAYALARELDEPLLYKGKDFAKTDVASALS